MMALQRPHQIALVFSRKTTTKEEQAAAMQGLERFMEFGLLVEPLDADTQRIGLIKCGTALKRLATKATQSDVIPEDLWHLSLANVWHIIRDHPLTTGIALTSSQLTSVRHGDKLISERTKAIGLSRNGGGAVVNVRAFDFIEDAAIRNNAIRLAMIHELGHVFGVVRHCTAENCVMQENQDKQDFIARFVIPGLDFCGNCVATITREISRMAEKTRHY